MQLDNFHGQRQAHPEASLGTGVLGPEEGLPDVVQVGPGNSNALVHDAQQQAGAFVMERAHHGPAIGKLAGVAEQVGQRQPEQVCVAGQEELFGVLRQRAYLNGYGAAGVQHLHFLAGRVQHLVGAQRAALGQGAFVGVELRQLQEAADDFLELLGFGQRRAGALMC